MTPLQLDDIQGVILRGFRSYHWVRHLLFRIADVDGARTLCGMLAPGSGAPMTVTLAAPWPDGVKPPYCLSAGMSNHGLRQLVGDAFYASLVTSSNPLFGAFDTGADDPVTAKTVGDTGDSAPANWWKNGGWQPSTETPSQSALDILLTLYAPSKDARAQWAETLLAMTTPALELKFVCDSDPLDPPDSIHFGYVDGISQPRVAGVEEVFGANEADDRPIVPSQHFVIDHTVQAVDPFLDRGCFGAFRLLYQDVKAFEAFLAQTGQPDLVAAKMCGRWKDGTPVEVSPDGPDPSITGLARVNYNYLSKTPNQQNAPASPDFDTYGQRCPYGSHVRRTNPRDDSNVTGNTNNSEMHRVMRRAFAYGPPYADDPEAQRGLVGLFMGADLIEQFEFVMGTWIFQGFFRTPDLSPNGSGIDPLFGTTNPNNAQFTYLPTDAALPPATASYVTTNGLTRFVRTDGGLYVFLPSITALKRMAAAPLLIQPLQSQALSVQ